MGRLLAAVEQTSDDMDRDAADGWIVVTVDNDTTTRAGDRGAIVHAQGVYDSPEQALVAAGKLAQEESQWRSPDEPPWDHVVAPIFFDSQ